MGCSPCRLLLKRGAAHIFKCGIIFLLIVKVQFLLFFFTQKFNILSLQTFEILSLAVSHTKT